VCGCMHPLSLCVYVCAHVWVGVCVTGYVGGRERERDRQTEREREREREGGGRERERVYP
jgi:hypothetical protein